MLAEGNCFLLPKKFKSKKKPEAHSLTRNFDDNDYIDKRGTKEVARFDLDFFDDVVKTFSLKTPFCGFRFHVF